MGGLIHFSQKGFIWNSALDCTIRPAVVYTGFWCVFALTNLVALSRFRLVPALPFLHGLDFHVEFWNCYVSATSAGICGGPNHF